MDRLALAAVGGAPSVGSLLIPGSLLVLTLGYFYIFWDRRREDSPNRNDGQVGLKLVLYMLLMLGLGVAAGGVETIVGCIAALFKNAMGQKSWGPIKEGISSLVAGGAGVAAVWFLFLPRTNAKEYPQAERFVTGAVAALAGIATVLGLEHLLQGFFGALSGWPAKAYALARLLVSGGVAILAINRFGALSGWQMPVKPVAASPQYPQGYHQGGYQQAQGYQQPQQGYQQAQGYQQPQQGYQQPQQGYQGGSNLPPPQGGGYPPQGGGGYPPR